jgi:uncharacterized protein YigE (DUF2233 family)
LRNTAPRLRRQVFRRDDSIRGAHPSRVQSPFRLGQLARYIVVVAVLFAQIAAADWRVLSTGSEQSVVPGIERRHIVLQNSADETAKIDLAAFSTKTATLHLIDNPSGSENLANVMRRENFIAGVNGGYFDAEFRPLGLRVIDGATGSPLLRARLLTGVLCGSSRGIEIVRLREFSPKKKCDAAIECGPFLIDRGMPVRGLDQSRRARRTFVGVTRPGIAILGVSNELSLAELASALAAVPDFKIWRALNLDGGSSTAFWFRRNGDTPFSITEKKAVRDFVGIAPR